MDGGNGRETGAADREIVRAAQVAIAIIVGGLLLLGAVLGWLVQQLYAGISDLLKGAW